MPLIDRVGAKKDLERVERWIKKHAVNEEAKRDEQPAEQADTASQDADS